jgi:2-amino-4-hydroxy-6-hydroxymethyldihydropteridine diphosphokinase
MSTCLVGLGSNLGDRAATLDAAIGELESAAGIESVVASAWQMTFPIGGVATQPAFLNGAARFETSRSAWEVLALLQEIEQRHGRERDERWGDRTLDLDLLLYGDEVIDSPALTVPHPRMSYRRFVLEPAAEVAGDMVHPTIGATVSELLDRLENGADRIAIVSQDRAARAHLSGILARTFGLHRCTESFADNKRWPADSTTWLAIPQSQQSAEDPKLTVLLQAGSADANRGALGHGPTLCVPAADGQSVEADVFAAIEAVWPRLGPLGEQSLQ